MWALIMFDHIDFDNPTPAQRAFADYVERDFRNPDFAASTAATLTRWRGECAFNEAQPNSQLN